MFADLLRRERSFSVGDTAALVLAIVVTVCLLLGGFMAARDLGRFAKATESAPPLLVTLVAPASAMAEGLGGCAQIDPAQELRYGDGVLVAGTQGACAAQAMP